MTRERTLTEYRAAMADDDSASFYTDETVPTCDLCGEPWEDGGEGEDWNGDTGNHVSCEAHEKLHAHDPRRNGCCDRLDDEHPGKATVRS